MSDQQNAGLSDEPPTNPPTPATPPPPAQPATPAPPVAPLTPPPPPAVPPSATPPATTPVTETDDDEETRRRRRYIVLGLIILLVLLLCLGGILYYLFAVKDKGNTPTPNPTTSSVVVTTPATTATTATTTATTATTTSGPATITVPVVVGKTAGEATTILKGAGFVNVTVVVAQPDGSTKDGSSADNDKKVVSVNPAEGSSVAANTPIVLTVEGVSSTIGNG